MELPVHSDLPMLRPAAEVHALGKAAQANVVQLRVAATRRGIADMTDIAVNAPGAIVDNRSALIDHDLIRTYNDDELHIRLREQWGVYCALCWLVRAGGLHDFGRAAPDADMHCTASVEVKAAEVHALLWRIRFELRRRTDAEFPKSKEGRRAAALAARIPLIIQGKASEKAATNELLAAGCEHAGMLAALRWSIAPTRRWGDPALMDVMDEPFPSTN